MVNYRPEHCPYCGAELSTLTAEGGEALYCDDCDRYVFHNPVPTASVAVATAEELLLVERAVGRGAGEWLVPGGHLEIGERPAEGAVRELREETGLDADPADLALLYADAIEPKPGKHNVVLRYAVHADATEGTLSAASDAADARFWTPAGFDAADVSYHDVPGLRYGGDDLAELLAVAHGAVGP
jgi:ADP-ribose pyrophosphatase YjhB (NUDIX family)